MTQPHIALTTSYQDTATLGPARRYSLETTDADCFVLLCAGNTTSDLTDGVPIGVLNKQNPTLQVADSAGSVKYKLLSGSVTGAVWCDGDAAPVTVAATAFSPSVSGDFDGTITTVAGGVNELAARTRIVEVSEKTAQYTIPISLMSGLLLATGAPMAVFASGASSVPGIEVTNSKACSVRWNNHATPAAIVVTTPMPQDLDDAQDLVFHGLVSKIGATVGDATKLTIGAFEQVVGALHDADSDMGGDTGAVTGNATSKTLQEITLVLDKANIHASPGAITLTIKPKAGTLGTDNLCLHAAWFEGTRKPLAS